MEYVTVLFAQKRQVYIDGKASGKTGETLPVDTGTHTFTLGDPRDYSPSFLKTVVQNTTAINPLQVTFEMV